MNRSLAKNPNMLRTMIGTGMTLVLVLTYAVYSNTVDSEYFGYETTNESINMELIGEADGEASWYYTSNAAITWINVTVSGAPDGSELIVEAEGFQSNWSHSPNLGLTEGRYVCNEPESDYSGLIETCRSSRIHTMILEEGSGTIRGRMSLSLPIQGKGYIENSNIDDAEKIIRDLISSQNKTITWKISIENNGNIISNEGIDVKAEFAKHEFSSIEKFSLNPVQETIYSLAALVGCFFLMLVIPLMIYFSAVYRDKRDEAIRNSIE